MKTKLKRTLISFFTLTFLCLSLLVAQGEAFDRRPAAPHHNAAGLVKKLPAGYKVIHIGNASYFVHNGRYYQKKPGGFVVIRAPIGALVTVLPHGFSTIVVGGTDYFLADSVYYRRVPEGYLVVNAPISDSIADNDQVIVQVAALNVRSGPGRDHPVVDHVRQGVRLTVEGNAPGWYYVQLPGGRCGWVMGEFVQPVPQG